ncbi:ATP-binding protein [Streptomyces sp. NBC_00582]|uniref:ATP-binding protein n=1 Tax=Streptomyces sp. NBC_00582 TaxID=2975783 RepID=UPI002E822C62|nr:ATP-binding protein [Streptomyces sp. NBC_00582]WUB64315.1 ATP-binding protein [Streptomyces sp. NBC_00582]
MTLHEQTEHRLRYVLPFEAEPAELTGVRRAVRDALSQWGAAALAPDAELAVTELATNVIKHVGEGAAVTLVLEPKDDRLRVELHDKSHAVPTLIQAGWEGECGRGLHLVASMCLDWGTLLTATGKAVWCELSLESARHCVRVQRAAAVLTEYRRVAGTSSVAVPTYAVLEESVTDIIADLLHWLTAQGGDPDDVLDRAQMHFEAEAEAA